MSEEEKGNRWHQGGDQLGPTNKESVAGKAKAASGNWWPGRTEEEEEEEMRRSASVMQCVSMPPPSCLKPEKLIKMCVKGKGKQDR